MNYPTDLSAEEQLRARARLADPVDGPPATRRVPRMTGSSPPAPYPRSHPPGSIRPYPAR